MSINNISIVNVFFMQGLKKLPMGQLFLRNRQIYFEYTSEFIKTGLELSPFKLQLKPGVIACEDRVFEGLFGVFNDSLPDGWGRLLLDRKLMNLGINPKNLSPLDRLSYVGHHGMGALIYEPEIEGIVPVDEKDLDKISDEAWQFQEKDENRFVDELLSLTGSSAGARPKILVTIDGEDWIIKLHSYLDVKDSGPIEYAYHLLARQAGLEVPLAKIFPSKKGPGYFGVKRFDRNKSQRIHMHTVSGLLHADHQFPSLDYEAIMQCTFWLTKDFQECEKLFRAAVFNVLSYNRDDHAKNFSFLMNEIGEWRLSPSYDLTFSSGPSGEHCTMVMGEGKNPNVSHLLKLALIGGIESKRALMIIDEVKVAISNWDSVASNAGVSISSIKRIKNSLRSH